MSGNNRHLQAKRLADRSRDEEAKAQAISDMTGLVKNGQISPRRFLEITRQILDGDADRAVRVGEDFRPDIQTGDQR
jgi:hypothetical protein